MKRGQPFDRMPDLFILFIMESDYLNAGLPAYVAERFFRHARKTPAGDRTYYIIINGQYRGEGEIGELMADFHCFRPEDMKNPILAYGRDSTKGMMKGEKSC